MSRFTDLFQAPEPVKKVEVEVKVEVKEEVKPTPKLASSLTAIKKEKTAE